MLTMFWLMQATALTVMLKLAKTSVIECVRDSNGRVYALTEESRKIAEAMPITLEEIKLFLNLLLKKEPIFY